MAGAQHKYPDTLLYFPAEGQTCHSYCGYCFRWLFADVAAARTLGVMAHYSHSRELEADVARRALARVLETGASVRCQAPVIRGVNSSAQAWADLWAAEVRGGAIPYYMFVERDTGARRFFEVPLARALEIYDDASARVSGLARTARGPVMSAAVGKVLVDGAIETPAGNVFALKLIRSRDPALVNRTELAEFDPGATWLDQLRSLDDPGRRPFTPLDPTAEPLGLDAAGVAAG